MTRNIQHRDGLHAADQKFLANIEIHGWNVTNVFRSEGETGPEWSYSTGLFHSYQHPEILMFGLDRDNMHKLINNIGNEVKSGVRFEPGNEYQGIFAKCGCQFRAVESSHYREYLGWAIWFYEEITFPTFQCFWPDRDGQYPWDPNCSPSVVSVQPLLFKPS